MGAEVKVTGRVRGVVLLDQYAPNDEDTQIHVNAQGEQLMAQSAAPSMEIVRMGRAFSVRTATAVASVVAIPTTAIGLALYNGEPDGGRSYIIDRVWGLFTVNSAAVPHAGIIGILGQVREALPTDASLVIMKMNGLGKSISVNSNADSKAMTLTATTIPTTTGVAAGWFAIGDSINAAVTSLPGFQKAVNVDGRVIVPPGRYFAIHTLASVTSCSAQLGIEWHEKQLLVG